MSTPSPPIENHPGSVWIVMAAWNEGSVIGDVIDNLEPLGHRLVVVDDGSTDRTHTAVSERGWVDLLQHPVNLGQGAALQTGITYALSNDAAFIVTFDSDGQHPSGQIADLLAPLRNGEADIALGSRFLDQRGESAKKIPAMKRLTLKLAALFTRMTTGLCVTDAHNGFRAMTAQAAHRITIEQNRMAHASEITSKIAKEKLRFVEIPVAIRYTDYSREKGQRLSNAFNILWDSIFGKIRR